MQFSGGIWNNKSLIKVLKDGGVVVMPTDTIYGVVGRAKNSDTVERIYKLRKRNPKKPCIILVGSLDELEKFGISLNKEQKKVFKKYKPVPTSFILDCSESPFCEKFSYLHRGTKTLAFRLPTQEGLRNLLLETGPLIAPSANIEGEEPSHTITEAKEYFTNKHADLVDLYIDSGEIISIPSKIIRLYNSGSVYIIR